EAGDRGPGHLTVADRFSVPGPALAGPRGRRLRDRALRRRRDRLHPRALVRKRRSQRRARLRHRDACPCHACRQRSTPRRDGHRAQPAARLRGRLDPRRVRRPPRRRPLPGCGRMIGDRSLNVGDAASEVRVVESGIRHGVRLGLPLAVARLADGLVFGMLARQAGLSTAEATLMSGLVFAGTAQFLAVGLWGSPVPIASILLTTLGVNLRHLLMGATLRSWLGAWPGRRVYPSLFFL